MNIADRLRQTIGYAARASVSSSGDSTFSTATTLPARVEDDPTYLRRGPLGAHAQAKAMIWVGQQVYVGDRIWLPGKDTSKVAQALEVIGVDGTPDLDGVTEFWAVMLA